LGDPVQFSVTPRIVQPSSPGVKFAACPHDDLVVAGVG
jgi:hypothetical protein